MSGPNTEPSSDLRQMANALWQTYVALTRAGFTEQQAVAIIGQMLAANAMDGGAAQ